MIPSSLSFLLFHFFFSFLFVLSPMYIMHGVSSRLILLFVVSSG